MGATNLFHKWLFLNPSLGELIEEATNLNLLFSLRARKDKIHVHLQLIVKWFELAFDLQVNFHKSSLGAISVKDEIFDLRKWIDVHLLQIKDIRTPGDLAKTKIICRVKSKASRKIICSTISNTGALLAYSDQEKPRLYEFERGEVGKLTWDVRRQTLPQRLPFAHSMIFTHDLLRDYPKP
ncbi:hypothetical protein Fmac_006396 [Flemingia macrophylla]|uniref:Uncharacterized protein n=1 Tax=Flemingia macrophylla TaxID=520843 RepID=A0ABD1NAG9_9FABA